MEINQLSEELENQQRANKLQQTLIDKLKSELEDYKGKSFEYTHFKDISQETKAVKESYEKQIKMKNEEILIKNNVIREKDEEIQNLISDIERLQEENSHMLKRKDDNTANRE